MEVVGLPVTLGAIRWSSISLGVWLPEYVRWKAPDAPWCNMVAPCGPVRGRLHPELEFTLHAPRPSGGLGV